MLPEVLIWERWDVPGSVRSFCLRLLVSNSDACTSLDTFYRDVARCGLWACGM